jgi:glutamine cyclotransferase
MTIDAPRQWFKKLASVFSFFSRRQDVVLWWRPHPLLETNVSSMRPALVEEYNRLVGAYKKARFWIYDDTPDVHRAIARSDAYYGDMSSLTELYKYTGKPVFLQDYRVTEEDDSLTRRPLTFENLYDDGENFWFTAWHFNALFKMDKQTWKAEYMGSFPGERFDGQRLYTQITGYKGKLYFAPGSADEIACFVPNTREFSKIRILPSDEIIETQKSRLLKFCDIVSRDNSLFFIACAYPAFIKLNPDTNETEFFSDWVKLLNKFVNAPDDAFFWHRAEVVGSRFYIASCNANAVVSFDMETLKSTVYEVGSKGNGYSDMCYDGEHFWLSPRNDTPIVKWSPATFQATEIRDFPEGFSSIRYSYNDIIILDGNPVLFPCAANMVLKVSMADGEVAVDEDFQDVCEKEESEQIVKKDYVHKMNYVMATMIDGVIYARTGKTNSLIAHNPKTGERREEQIFFTEESAAAFRETEPLLKVLSIAETLNNENQDERFITEDFVGLRDFLDYLVSNADGEKPPREGLSGGDENSGHGKAIYLWLRERALNER